MLSFFFSIYIYLSIAIRIFRTRHNSIIVSLALFFSEFFMSLSWFDSQLALILWLLFFMHLQFHCHHINVEDFRECIDFFSSWFKVEYCCIIFLLNPVRFLTIIISKNLLLRLWVLGWIFFFWFFFDFVDLECGLLP